MGIEYSERLTSYANLMVGHSQPDATKTIPTFGDVDQALDGLGELVMKYSHILLAMGGEIEPSVIDPWQNIFMFPWIKPDKATKKLLDEVYKPKK